MAAAGQEGKLSGENVHLPKHCSRLVLEWANDSHSHSSHTTTTWASRAFFPATTLTMGLHPCLKMNLVFLPEEENGSEADADVGS